MQLVVLLNSKQACPWSESGGLVCCADNNTQKVPGFILCNTKLKVFSSDVYIKNSAARDSKVAALQLPSLMHGGELLSSLVYLLPLAVVGVQLVLMSE